MARVFVSHASKDGECAGRLRQWLVAEGHEVFLDQDLGDGLVVGEEWEKRLHERLRWADAVVCVVTSASVASTWCTAEVSIAVSRGSRLLPVRVEPKVDHPLLRSAQYADFTVDASAGRAALVEALRRVDAAGGWGWPDDRSPFPGLRPFDVDDHRAFFGRSREVDQLAELLRSPAERAEGAVLLVVGPSGCGKSSLVRAGLLHVMAQEPGWWTLPAILPGSDPVAALVRELAAGAQRWGLGWTVAQVRDQLADGGLTGLADELLLAARARRLLVVVDQFEEVLTQAPATARSRFARLVHPAIGGPVQVVATLRPEFLEQLLSDPDLAMLPTRTHALRPLRREALRTVIEGPAELADIKVDDELVARLVDDTDSGEALPLLAFTLAQLGDGIGRGGQLSTRRYSQIGGVQGALASQADAALTEACAATGRSSEQVIASLLQLVTVDELSRPTRWRVPRNELPTFVVRELDAFVRKGLLTSDIDGGRVVVGVAHEAFLSAWGPFAKAIQDNMVALRARRAVEQAAAEWNDDGRRSLRLWERGQLASAVADTGARLQALDLVTDRVELTPLARAFLRTSIHRDRLRRGRAIIVLSVLLVLALVAAGIAFVEQRSAKEQRNVAVSRQAVRQVTDLRAPNPALAAQLGLAAYRLSPSAETRGSLLSAVADRYATRLTGHTGYVNSVAFTPDGHTLATGSADKTARLWDVSDPHHPSLLSTIAGHSNAVNSVAFSPDGRILATGGADNNARLSDVSDPHHPSLLTTLTGHTNGVDSVAFSPDGHTLATGSLDKTARLWDISDPRHSSLFSTLTGHSDTVDSVAFSPDGHTLATGSLDKTARLWDISDPRHSSLFSTLTGHANTVDSVAFSHDGHTLATAGLDKTIRLWEVSDPRHPVLLGILAGHTSGVTGVAFSHDGRTLASSGFDSTARLWDLPGPIVAGHTNTVWSVAFSPDGRTLATASADNTARLWDVSDPYHPNLLSTLTGHTDYVRSVAFSRDGQALATGSADNTARLWDISDPRHPSLLSTLTGHTDTVPSVAFSRDGHTLVTGSFDNTARLWDISDPYHPSLLSTLTGHTDHVWSVTFSPDGLVLVTTSADKTARLWEVSDPRHPHLLSVLTGHTSEIYSVGFSPDGRTLASTSFDNTARLWDISTPRHPSLLSTLTGHTNIVYSAAFSWDGRTVATGSYDRTVRLWDVSDPRHPGLLSTLTGHSGDVYSVAFSPNGHTLATGSYDKTARLWETNIDIAAARICTITWPTVSENEWSEYLPNMPYRPPCS